MGRRRQQRGMNRRTLVALAALLLIPLADALVLVGLAVFVLDWRVAVALAVLTGLVGMLVVRAEGRHTLRSLERKVRRGDLPTDELLDGGLLIAAGAALLTPGVVTDLLGFLLAFPVTRYPARKALERFVVEPYLDKRLDGLVSGQIWTGGFPREEDVVDVEGGSRRPDEESG